MDQPGANGVSCKLPAFLEFNGGFFAAAAEVPVQNHNGVYFSPTEFSGIYIYIKQMSVGEVHEFLKGERPSRDVPSATHDVPTQISHNQSPMPSPKRWGTNKIRSHGGLPWVLFLRVPIDFGPSQFVLFRALEELVEVLHLRVRGSP